MWRCSFEENNQQILQSCYNENFDWSTGKQNALHQARLANLVGVTRRAIKSLIKKERLIGTPILSDNRGYWMAANNKEIEDFKKLMTQQARSILAVQAYIKYSIVFAKRKAPLSRSLHKRNSHEVWLFGHSYYTTFLRQCHPSP